jgi:hypothetical protein
MKRIEKNETQVLFSVVDRANLCNNLECAFIALDTSTSYGAYSGENIRNRYPSLWELFVTLRGEIK